MNRWYAVQTKNKLEQFATDHLKNQGYDVFYPAYQKRLQRNHKMIIDVRPLYPSYLFVRFGIEQTRWRSINGTQGVVGLVGSGEDWVTPVPQGFVEQLVDNCNFNGFVDLEESVHSLVQYSPGTELEIIDSSFKGLVGMCCESTPQRVTLFLTLLGKQTRVRLPSSSVRMVEPGRR